MVKLNHGLNISCNFLNFIWNKYNDNHIYIYINRYYIFKLYYLC